MTVQDVIDVTIKKTGVIPLEKSKTCDNLITGNLTTQVKKIGSTFMATVEVIEQAIEQGINLIITHEPTWFTGYDDTEWLQNDEIYLKKKKLIEDNKIAIWRFHDHMHMAKEDGIYRGFEKELNWSELKVEDTECKFGSYYDLNETTLKELAELLKEQFCMNVVQIIGCPEMKVSRVSVLVGGGSLGLGIENKPMIHFKEKNIDVAICGDIVEWTLPAYVRDASQLGLNKGLIILGHERTEEWGMKHLCEWLKPELNGIEIKFIDAKEPFLYL